MDHLEEVLVPPSPAGSLGEGRCIGKLSFAPVSLSFLCVSFTPHTKPFTSGRQMCGGFSPRHPILCAPGGDGVSPTI